MDRLDPVARSRLMSRIRRSDTKPERLVRSMLHRAGYRFRIQLKGVPGRPDVAFPGRRAAILIHGCFWHQHPGCRHATVPSTRPEFWKAKFERNRERDARLLAEAEAMGWRTLVIWECETMGSDLCDRLVAFLGPPRTGAPPVALPLAPRGAYPPPGGRRGESPAQ